MAAAAAKAEAQYRQGKRTLRERAEPVIECRGLKRSFREAGGELTVLEGIDLTVAAAERVAIVGASGSGKTTLLQLLGGLDAPSGGEISICGKAMHRLGDSERGRLRNEAIGFVYQFHHLLPEFTAEENVAIPIMATGRSRGESVARAGALLDRVGLDDRRRHRPAEMSGGEQQRVAICRALANSPRVLLADEPTGNLDPETAGRVFAVLLEVVRETGLAALIATHNGDLAARMDRVVRLEGGQVRAA